MKKILIHSIVFHPDSVSTAYLLNDLALGLKSAGLEVCVLTTTPHYNFDQKLKNVMLSKRYYGLYYKSSYQGIKVIHIPQKKYKSTTLRILMFLYWHILSIIVSIGEFKKINTVFSVSPPLTIGLVGYTIAKMKGANCVYNVQELFPDLLISKGLKSKGIIWFLKKIEVLVYSKSDRITAINTDFKDKISIRIKDKSKVHYIPNFADLNLYNPNNISSKISNDFLRKENCKILMYAGNIGHYQNWDIILKASEKLRRLNVEFWIIGEGVAKQSLQSEIEKRQIHNIKVFKYQKREVIPHLINLADIHFIALNDKEDGGFPSKIYTIMACAKPMIVVCSSKSPLNKFLDPINCAELINTTDINDFVSGIKKLLSNKEYAKALGKNGYDFVQQNLTKDEIINRYVSLFKEI